MIKKLIRNIVRILNKKLKGMHKFGQTPQSLKIPFNKQRESFQNIAQIIDHTMLKADTSGKDLDRLCKEARKYHFKTVCVNGYNLPFVAKKLRGSKVLPITVVGFPLGAMTTEAKAFETKDAVKNGAKEIDMVINIGALKSKSYRLVLNDIKKIVETAKPYPVKVIIETALLTAEEKIIASLLCMAAKASFVKTSTGFSTGGAKEEDLILIRNVVGGKLEIKASGGIKTYEDTLKMIRAGADRIGSSASVAIVKAAGKK